MMKISQLSVACLFTGVVAGFSMSMRDVGITDDIHRVSSSLNDIFKESFELMIGSLGKHGVYYLPEIKHVYDYKSKPNEETKKVEFQTFNGWMKFPTAKASKDIASGGLRKYKVAVHNAMREILLVCVECLQISAEGINFCYEATYSGKNVSGSITSGPILYKVSLEMRVSQLLRNSQMNLIKPPCNISVGERSFELDDRRSNFRSEARGLRTLNFIAENVDSWIRDHFNSTVKAQLEKKFMTALNKTLTKHDVCEEFMSL